MPDYIKQEFKRYNATLNLDTEVTSWLEINMKMSLNRKEDDQPIKLWGTNTIDTFSDDLKPMQPVYFPDGHFSGQGGNSNPLAIATLGGRSTYNSDDIWMTGGFTLRPFKGLSIVGDYTWNSYRYNSKFNQKEFDQYGAPAAGADITDPSRRMPQASIRTPHRRQYPKVVATMSTKPQTSMRNTKTLWPKNIM